MDEFLTIKTFNIHLDIRLSLFHADIFTQDIWLDNIWIHLQYFCVFLKVTIKILNAYI